MKRSDRIKIINKIREVIGLPRPKKIEGYFSRKELLEILTYLELKYNIGDQKNEKKNNT